MDTFWNFDDLDFQFRHCGPLNPNVGFPWNPMIHKIVKKNHTDTDKHLMLNIIRKIVAKTGNILGIPIEVIRKLETIQLTERQKALYFKSLYNLAPIYIYKINYTLGEMHNDYYSNVEVDTSGYTLAQKGFISRCIGSDIPIVKVYKMEYMKYSRAL